LIKRIIYSKIGKFIFLQFNTCIITISWLNFFACKLKSVLKNIKINYLSFALNYFQAAINIRIFRSSKLLAFFLILVDTFNYALGALRSITSLCTTSINKIVPSIASHARPFTSHFSRHHYCPSPLSTSPPASSEINASADTATIVCWVFDSRVNEFNPERSRRYRSIRENLDSYCEEGKRDVYR